MYTGVCSVGAFNEDELRGSGNKPQRGTSEQCRRQLL